MDGSPYYLDGTAGVIAFLVYSYLHRDALLQFLYVTDDAYVSARFRVETSERVDGMLERLAA